MEMSSLNKHEPAIERDGARAQGADTNPLPLREGRQEEIFLNEEINPLLRPGIGERYS